MKAQRALVLQGGGALGAYDAGVLRALCKRIHEIDGSTRSKTRNVFDILAGTSSGAINASIVCGIVTRSVAKAKDDGREPDLESIWDSATDRLCQFWKEDLSVLSAAENDPYFDERWDTYGKFNESAAPAIAARRFYATRQFLLFGVKNVFKAPVEIRDEKFFDRFNTWYLYDNSPLRNSLKECGCFPIASQIEDGHPRLLMVAVDVEHGVAATFDSYKKGDGSRFSEYGDSNAKIKIPYDSGITEAHVIASASVPVNYPYAELQDSNNATHYYWDGGWLSNTRLRELINEHQDFWTWQIGKKALESDMWKDDGAQGLRKIPNLRVYITNVWPRAVVSLPRDYDKVVERSRDMFFLDKTDYDQKVSRIIDDYIGLAKRIRQLGLDNASNKEVYVKSLEGIMNDLTATSKNLGKDQDERHNVNLIRGRLDVRVHRIRLSPEEDSISAKFFDFSRSTINELIDKGMHDAKNQFEDIFSKDT